MVLLGEFHCTADSMGRLRLPPEFRTQLDAGLTLTRGIEPCLFVYPAREWQELADKMRRQLSLTNRDARAFARLLFSGAKTCAPNQQGCIPLPTRLREYAGIEADDTVIVIGLGTHLELWNARHWQQVKEQIERDGISLGEKLRHLDL